MGIWGLFFIVIITFVNEMVGRRFNIGGWSLSESEGHNLDYWGKIIIVVLMVSTYIFIVNDGSVGRVVIGGFFAALLFYQAIMEWRFLEGKKHVVSIVSTALIVTVIIVG